MKIGILGGGLAGLTLGNNLKKDFKIFEKNNECGGLCRTLQKKGFTFDYGGSHIIFSRNKEILNYMTQLLGENKNKIKRNTKILFKKNYVKYPFENGLHDLPKRDNFECLYYFIQNFIKKEKGEIAPPINFKEWMYYTFGEGITEKYLLPYNEKIWNYPADKMNVDWVKGRVPSPPIGDIVKSSLGIKTEGYTHQLYFYYPKKEGIHSLIKSLEKPIKDKIKTDIELEKIEKYDGKWRIEYNNGKSELFDRIVSTIPLQEILKLIENVPKKVENAINDLICNSLITIMVGIDKPELNNISWLYIPGREDGRFNRVSFPFNFSSEVVPKGKSSLLVEITCNYNDDVWSMDNQKLIGETINDLDKLEIIDKNDVCFSEIVRSKYAYIIFDHNYQKNIRIVYDYFEKLGIKLCGRFSEFKYLNMDAAIESAFNTARIYEEVE